MGGGYATDTPPGGLIPPQTPQIMGGGYATDTPPGGMIPPQTPQIMGGGYAPHAPLRRGRRQAPPPHCGCGYGLVVAAGKASHKPQRLARWRGLGPCGCGQQARR
jgi:hypothetical protein